MNILRIALLGILFLFTTVINATNYEAAPNKESSPDMSSGDSDGGSSTTSNPSTYNPVQGLGTGNLTKPPQTNYTNNNSINKDVDLQIQIINSQNESLPVYLWVSPVNPDGTVISSGTRKGPAPKGFAYFRNVPIGQSYKVLIRPNKGKVEIYYVTISQGENLKLVKGKLVYVATFVLD